MPDSLLVLNSLSVVRSVLTAASILATEENVREFENDFDSPPRSSEEGGITEGQFDDAGKLNHFTLCIQGIFTVLDIYLKYAQPKTWKCFWNI